MTITTEQLDALEHRSKDDNLAKMIVGSEVRELIAEVRRLAASLAEMRECYIARTEDRDRAEAELSNARLVEQALRSDRAVLVAAMERLATCECCPFNDSDIARAALRSVCETDSQAKVGEFPGSSPSEETP